MHLRKDRVVIVKSLNFKEADKILTLFGRERGKFSIIAKGIRKIESKNRGNMQTLSISDISYFEGRNLGVLRESTTVTQPDYQSMPIPNIEKVLFMLSRLMPEDVAETEIFDSIIKMYENNFDLREVNRFRVRTLIALGFLSDMKSCIQCDSTENLNYFSTQDIGLVCANCAKNSSIIKPLLLTDVKYESPEMDSVIDALVRDLAS